MVNTLASNIKINSTKIKTGINSKNQKKKIANKTERTALLFCSVIPTVRTPYHSMCHRQPELWLDRQHLQNSVHCLPCLSSINNTHTGTPTIRFYNHIPFLGLSRSVSPLIFSFHRSLSWASSRDRPKLSISTRPPRLVLSISINIYLLYASRVLRAHGL